MSQEQKNRQELACEFIFNNYVAYKRLRYDLVAQKVQVRGAHCSENGKDQWQYISNADINSMVCDCCAETGVNITSREILTVLNAGEQYIPRVHPLREYVNNVKPFTPDQPDWIDFVASQVKVKSSGESATDRPKGLSERTSCCQTTTLLDRPYGADRPMNLTGEADLTVSEANGLGSNSSQCERSAADRLWRVCFKKWFVAMVASWMKDEVESVGCRV